MHYEQLQRTDIPQIWTIDRSEIIDQIYVVQDGIMVLQDAPFVAHGWPPNTPEQATPTLIACYDRGGDFWAAWDGTQLAGIAVLDHQPVTSRPDLLQLLFLHVGRPYRGSGVGEHLFRHAQAVARQWGAAGLYVSATPTRRTIAFYQRMGCRLMTQPDPTLFAEEPEDLHLECGL